MNKVILNGRLAANPHTREIEHNGKTVLLTDFTVAVSRLFKKSNGEKEKEVNYVPCEVWDTGAEAISKMFVKGDPILVEGSVKTGYFEKDGKRISTFKIRVNNFEKLARFTKVE